MVADTGRPRIGPIRSSGSADCCDSGNGRKRNVGERPVPDLADAASSQFGGHGLSQEGQGANQFGGCLFLVQGRGEGLF